MKRLLHILLACVAAVTAAAADSTAIALRPVFSSWFLEAGSSRLADTYLSPIPYKGSHVAFTYQRYQAMAFSPERWTMSLTIGAALDHTRNRARNSTMTDISLEASWGMMRRYPVTSWLSIAPGASTSVSAGAIYAPANSNNPVSAKAAWTLDITALVTARFHISRLPVTVMYRPTLPVTGIFFSPDYGELYYEIYLGNSSGLVHPAFWGRYFMLDNLLTANLQLGATQLTVGYHGRILSTRINHLTTNVFTHAFVIGISTEWLSLNPRRPLPAHSRTINALY